MAFQDHSNVNTRILKGKSSRKMADRGMAQKRMRGVHFILASLSRIFVCAIESFNNGSDFDICGL